MSKKINLLIIASILGLIALSIIQAYLINNTYKLKKNAFLKETKKAISKINDLSPELDKINDIWQDHLLATLADYKIKKINKTEVLSLLNQKTDSLNGYYTKIYKEELDKKNIPFHLKFQKRVKAIILIDSVQNDTLFFSNSTTPKLHLLGNNFEEKDGHTINSSLWLTEHIFNHTKEGKTISRSYNLHFETEDAMNINGWEKIIFVRMRSLLIVSFLIFAFVFGLLYYSIKNLISQKKIATIKTDFVNNITHELKTPLATLSLATKILKNDAFKAKPEIVDHTILTIERQNKRLQKLIDQVLTNSLGYTEIKLVKENVIIHEYLPIVLEDFLLSVKEKNITLTREIPISNQKVLIDKFYFTTALFNILENAVKYNDNPIEIHCSLTTKENFEISISDNGIGITEKQQKQVFDKFYRSENKEIYTVNGLGLGLYYTHQIIKAHQGEIAVQSQLGKGTTFTIKIPLS